MRSKILDMLPSDAKSSRKAPKVKSHVLSDNIFEEHEKQRAKRIFMNKLTGYLET